MVTQTHTHARRDVFQAIADPNRRAIIGLLTQKKLTLNEVADHFDVSRPAISKHVKILMECGLVRIEQQGRERFCELTPERLTEVSDWLEQYRTYWEEKLDALEVYLAELQAEGVTASIANAVSATEEASEESNVAPSATTKQGAKKAATRKSSTTGDRAGASKTMQPSGRSKQKSTTKSQQ